MGFETSYAAKCQSSEHLAEYICSGQTIYSDITLAQPKKLLEAIGAKVAAGELREIMLHNILDVYPMPCYAPETQKEIRGVSWFCGTDARKAMAEGRGDVMPGYYRDFPRLIRETQKVDVLIAAVSPMDKHGYFSFSTVGSVSNALLDSASCILLEVNDWLPRAVHAPQIHISRVTGLCECSYPLPVLPAAKPDAVSTTIGSYIAEQIPNGATLQLGIGAIPDAVGMALRDKHDLGLHTEMFTDSMVELLECGAVTNHRKPIYRDYTVATFAFGSQRIYDYLDDNPSIALLPVDYVNDPHIIAQHPDFISVNAALEVDFFGQVCAESIGPRVISGTGGQSDYVRGAALSPGGKSFIAFPSTAKGGTVSRIVPTLTNGALVSTSKNDVDCIVTEYGIAQLRGHSLRERTKALIGIAHPKFREELTFAAKKHGLLL